jgi:hypothetical protein
MSIRIARSVSTRRRTIDSSDVILIVIDNRTEKIACRRHSRILVTGTKKKKKQQ